MKRPFVAMVLFAQILLLILNSGLMAAVSPEVISQTDAAIETLRKRNCTVNVTIGGLPLAGKEVRVTQIRNDFAFGGCITTLGFTHDSVAYGNAFAKYFDWATPENEMKWTTNDEMDDYTDFSAGDYLVDWCQSRGIKVRGHNLFWNEDKRWLPTWTHTLDPVQFKAAMARRIDGAVSHYKGKVAHWDVINELIHYPQATHGTPEVTLFDSAAADPDIFRWILSRARKIDSTVQFAVNEYAIVEDLDATPATMDIFTKKMNRLLTDTSSFEVVGLEGHFGGSVIRENYLRNLNTVTAAIPRKIWLTEVDFSIPVETRGDVIEELMRTCFAHPNVGGLILWVWWDGRRWGDHLNSVLTDSNFVETNMGERWRTLRTSWKSNASAIADASSKIAFRGFQGEYKALFQSGDSVYSGSFYLAPGTGDTAITVALTHDITATPVIGQQAERGFQEHFYLNGQKIAIGKRANNEQLFLYTYSVNGKLVSKMPIANNQRHASVMSKSAGCGVVRIGTESRTLYTGRLMNLK